MPIFSLDIGIPKIEKEIAALLDNNQITLLFSPVSLIEIKWEILRQIKRSDNVEEFHRNYQDGLRVLATDKNAIEVPLTDFAVDDITIALRNQGHKDYFDTVIGAKAILYANYLLTMDEGLIRQIKLYYNKNTIANENQILMGNWKVFLKYIKSY